MSKLKRAASPYAHPEPESDGVCRGCGEQKTVGAWSLLCPECKAKRVREWKAERKQEKGQR